MQATGRPASRTGGLGLGINHLLGYGQSLSSGWDGWPALSLRGRHGSLMLGASVRPAQEQVADWIPVGEPVLRPLVATMQDCRSGALLDAAMAAHLAKDRPVLGETVLEAAANTMRAFAHASGDDDTARSILASSCGVGGRTLEHLARGATPELFNRMRACVALAREVARRQALPYRLMGLVFIQGEHNSWGLDGGTSDRVAYGALLRQFRRDFLADISRAAAGQPDAPPMFLCQTGGAYASADNAVAQAQLDVALDTPGCALVGPTYPVTAKGGHLDANGYRWLGAQIGKAMHKVIALGEEWAPLLPLGCAWRGDAIELRFSVPVPPLRWGRPCLDRTLFDPPDRGFALADVQGDIPLLRVDIVAPDTVRIAPGRAPGDGARVLYASRRQHGRGALHDSDATVAPDCYIDAARDGPGDLADLHARPYPLVNWCVAFNMAIPPRP